MLQHDKREILFLIMHVLYFIVIGKKLKQYNLLIIENNFYGFGWPW